MLQNSKMYRKRLIFIYKVTFPKLMPLHAHLCHGLRGRSLPEALIMLPWVDWKVLARCSHAAVG